MILSVCFTSTLYAATIDPREKAYLSAEAAKVGWVPVLIHLRNTSLAEMSKTPEVVRAEVDSKFRTLSRDFGANALRNGTWSNGAGQVEIYLNSAGLDQLQASSSAIAFAPGRGWAAWSALLSLDGAHRAIESRLVATGSVELEVVLNVDGLEIEFGSSGSRQFLASDAAASTSIANWNEFVGNLREDERTGPPVLITAARRPAVGGYRSDIVARVNLTREGLLRLVRSDLARAIKPVGHIDSRERWLDGGLLFAVQQKQISDVIVTLRSDLMGGRLSRASVLALERSNAAALSAMTMNATHDKFRSVLSRVGSLNIRLTSDELLEMINSKDRRILALQLNAPVASAHLDKVATALRMSWAWNADFRGAGQAIAILDDGVDASHPFLSGKVVYQACFGTLSSSYQSDCPDANASTNWDSPDPTLGAGLAIFNSDHGTHVAGIAAGNGGANPLRGLAPDASIYSLNVFSKSIGGNALLAHRVDILAALHRGVTLLPALAAPNKRPVTINLSLGGGTNSTPVFCNADDDSSVPNSSFITAIHALATVGVPVIASTGNDNSVNGIAWPACLPGVIKVSATLNDTIGDIRAPGSNVVDPANYPGETFWLAPGGSVAQGGYVYSSSLNTAYSMKGGTSQASPIISGVYAVAKGAVPSWGPLEVTSWLLMNASANVSVSVGSPLHSVYWKRVLMP